MNKKRLNEILSDGNKLLALLKFSKKKYLNRLQKGILYLNNFQYFRDVEVKEQRKGQGDAFDVTLQISDIHITFKHPETHKVLFTTSAKKAYLEDKLDYQRHLFCMTGITTDLLEIVDFNKDVVTAKLILPEELERKAPEFGDHVMFLNANLFLERVRNVCAEKGIALFSGKVEYKDLSLNYTDRIEAFNTGNINFYFQKDKFFSYQNEFRLFFPGLISNEPETINIGSIKEFTTIFSIEDFFKHELLYKIRLIDESNKV